MIRRWESSRDRAESTRRPCGITLGAMTTITRRLRPAIFGGVVLSLEGPVAAKQFFARPLHPLACIGTRQTLQNVARLDERELGHKLVSALFGFGLTSGNHSATRLQAVSERADRQSGAH